MKKQIVNVSMLQNAKVAAALYFVVTIPFVLLFAIGMAFAPDSGALGVGMGIGMLIILPVLYAVFGFLFTLLFAWIYNLVAARVGGLEFTTVEVN